MHTTANITKPARKTHPTNLNAFQGIERKHGMNNGKIRPIEIASSRGAPYQIPAISKKDGKSTNKCKMPVDAKIMVGTVETYSLTNHDQKGMVTIMLSSSTSVSPY